MAESDPRFEEIFEIASDLERSKLYPKARPHEHKGERGQIWTCLTPEALQSIQNKDLRKIPGLAENEYWQPLGELSELSKRILAKRKKQV